MGRGPGVRTVGEEAIQIDFRYRGERCRERVRLAPTKANLNFCRQWKARIEHEIATGVFDYVKHFPESERARRLSITAEAQGAPILEAMRTHCDTLEGQVEPETLRDYRNDAETVATWFEPGTTTRTLTRKQIRDALAKPQNLALSRVRLTNMMKALRGALADIEEEDCAFRSPFTGFTWRRIEAAREDEVDPFTPEEMAALGGTSEGDLWTLWAWTGLRTGELIGIRIRDAGPDGAYIEIQRAIRRGRTKTPKTKAGRRRITLLPPARAALKNVLRRRSDAQPDDPVFLNPRTGQHWHNAQALSRAFRRACKQANVRYRYPYQHRHTFATWALSSGENPLWVAKVLGHKSVEVLYKHYARWMQQLDAQAGRRMVSKAHRGQAAA